MGTNQVSVRTKMVKATWIAARPQWYFWSIGLTNSVQPYCRLAIITMQMMPKISWPHRVASDAVARSTGALDATAMIFLPAYLASRRSWVADGSAKCAINLCSLHRLSAQGEYLVIRYYRA